MAWVIGTVTARASVNANPSTVASVAVLPGEIVLVVHLKVGASSARAGGSLTWGSQTLSQAGSTQIAASLPEASSELWYLLNPTPGTQTLTIPNTGSLTIFHHIVRGYFPGAIARLAAAWGTNNTSTNPSCGSAVLPESDNIVFAGVAGGHQDMTLVSAQTGTILHEVDDGATGGAFQYLLAPNPVHAGQAMSWTHATSEDWGATAAAFTVTLPHRFQGYMAVDVGTGMGTGDRLR